MINFNKYHQVTINHEDGRVTKATGLDTGNPNVVIITNYNSKGEFINNQAESLETLYQIVEFMLNKNVFTISVDKLKGYNKLLEVTITLQTLVF